MTAHYIKYHNVTFNVARQLSYEKNILRVTADCAAVAAILGQVEGMPRQRLI